MAADWIAMRRVKRIARIASVLGRMRHWEELRLVEANGDLADRQSQEQRLIEALGTGALGEPKLAKALVRRIERASGELALSAQRAEKQAGDCAAARRRLGLAESRLAMLERADERQRMHGELMDAIEWAAITASVRQAKTDIEDTDNLPEA